jgi:hypothetical protein
MDNDGYAVRRHRLLNICVTIFSIMLFSVLIEIGFRVFVYYSDSKIFDAFMNIGRPENTKDLSKNISLREIIQHSTNGHIIYELIPNISASFKNKLVRINSHGFRGPEFNSTKSNKTIRIVGLGDSLMFGWGVSDDEYYLVLLARYLNQSLSDGYIWEIINTAVPGYNTVMEVETLKAKGLPYKPDLVIIDYVMNDLDLPNFLRKEENYFTLRRSFAADYFVSRLTQHRSDFHNVLVDAPLNASRTSYENDPSRVPAQYRDMVGPDAYRAAMAELKTLGLKHNFQILAFTTYFPRVIKEILRELDFPMLEAGDAFTIFMAEHGIKEYVGSPLTVSDRDPHPSALGHTILADVLYNYLKDTGIVSDMVHKQRPN